MKRNGYPSLSRGEAMKRRLARMTPAERAALASSAHNAVRGMTRTDDDLRRRAIGKQRTAAHATDEERALAAHLQTRGVATIAQQAIGKYNLDIGAEPVAVELFGGNWHAHGRHLARLPQRVVDIADAGWNLLIVWCTQGRTLDVGPVAEDVVAYLERSRRDPTFQRQYRVIWGDGQLYSAGCVDDDDLALVPTSIRRKNIAR